ncbi:MAG: O-antigen ligase family protein [Bacteroidota bacterium]
MITILLWAALFTPLIISEGTLFPFQTGKGIAFRILVEIAAFLYFWLAILEPKRRPKPNALFWSVLAFGGVLGLTAILGVNPYRSFWGDLERMEGVFGILHGIALFVIVYGLFTRREDWVRFFSVSLAASFFIALYAFAQADPAFRFFPVVEAREIQPGSTFGHQSFVATYAIFQVFFGVFLVLLEKAPRLRVFAAVSIAVNLILLGLTAIRGAQIAMMASLVTGLILTAIFLVRNLRARMAIAGILLLSAGFLAGVLALKDSSIIKNLPYAFQRMASISPDAATARTRLISLGVSWEALKERPLTGWGQEHFAPAYNKHFNPEHLTYEQTWFDRAHNKLADVAVQNGIPGVAGYLAIFVVACIGLFRKIRNEGKDRREQWVAVSVIMLGAAYFVQNLFLFDTTTSSMLFFASLSFTAWLIGSDAKTGLKEARQERLPRSWRFPVVAVAGLLTLGVVLEGNWIPYTTASLGRESLAATDPGKALALYEGALASGGFPTAEVTRAMMEELINSGKVQRSEWSRVVDAVIVHAEVLGAGEYASVPVLVRLGKVYNEQWQREAGFLQKAERVLQKAIRLAPKHPDAYYELGVTHLRRGETEQALTVFRSALDLNVRNTRARWTLGLALLSVGHVTEGLREVESAVEQGYHWDTPADIKNLSKVYTWFERYDRIVWMYEQVVAKYPGMAEHRATLATAYAKTGETVKAKEEMTAAMQLDRQYEASAVQFIQNLNLSTTVQRSTP